MREQRCGSCMLASCCDVLLPGLQRHNHQTPRVDLERQLNGRDPPGRRGHVTYEDTYSRKADSERTYRTKELPVGRALVSSHHLSDPECQCRHDLTVSERLERGVSGNGMRSGVCPLTTKIQLPLSGYALPSIRLDLSNTFISEEQAAVLCNAIKDNRTLRELCLHNTQLDNAGARHIAKLLSECNPCRACAFAGLHLKLVELDLGHNQIGDAGASHLAEALYKNDRLRELALDANPIRQAGMQALLHALEVNSFCKVVLPVFEAVNSYRRDDFVVAVDDKES